MDESNIPEVQEKIKEKDIDSNNDNNNSSSTSIHNSDNQKKLESISSDNLKPNSINNVEGLSNSVEFGIIN